MAQRFTAGYDFAGATGLKTGQNLVDLVEQAEPTDALVDGSTLEVDGATKEVQVKDAGIVAAKIADGAVTHAKLATDSVETDNIKDANITTAKVLDGAITQAKAPTLLKGANSSERMEHGSATFTITGTGSSSAVTITFGAAFASAPRVMGLVVVADDHVTSMLSLTITGRTTTQMVVTAYQTVSQSRTLTVHWCVVGT